MATASMAVPTMAGVTGSMQSYAVGILAGVGYRMLSGFTGSGIIGGAIAAAVVGASGVHHGPAGAGTNGTWKSSPRVERCERGP